MVRWINRRRLTAAAVLAALALLVAAALAFYTGTVTRTVKSGLALYELGQRTDYPGPSRLRRKEGRTVLTSGGAASDLDSAPLYYAGEERLLLPETMLAVPSQDRLGKLEYFTELSAGETGYAAVRGPARTELPGGFLYDGRDRYLFLEAVTVRWGEKAVELAPLSWVQVRYNRRVEYYDRAADVCRVEETGKCTVTADAAGYSVDLGADLLTWADGRQLLLFQEPELLPALS